MIKRNLQSSRLSMVQNAASRRLQMGIQVLEAGSVQHASEGSHNKSGLYGFRMNSAFTGGSTSRIYWKRKGERSSKNYHPTTGWMLKQEDVPVTFKVSDQSRPAGRLYRQTSALQASRHAVFGPGRVCRRQGNDHLALPLSLRRQGRTARCRMVARSLR